MLASPENEIGNWDGGETPRPVFNMLKATGASDLAILKALDEAMVKMACGPFDRYLDISLPTTGGADDAIRATVHEDRLWADIAAAALERLGHSGFLSGAGRT